MVVGRGDAGVGGGRWWLEGCMCEVNCGGM